MASQFQQKSSAMRFRVLSNVLFYVPFNLFLEIPGAIGTFRKTEKCQSKHQINVNLYQFSELLQL